MDKQIFDNRSNMIELKYATRHVARIKEDCTKKKTNYTKILDILLPELAVSLGVSATKHQSYMYEALKSIHLIKNGQCAFN